MERKFYKYEKIITYLIWTFSLLGLLYYLSIVWIFTVMTKRVGDDIINPQDILISGIVILNIGLIFFSLFKLIREIVLIIKKINIYKEKNFIMKERDSIIFDLDGTLWNASETVSKAFNESIKDFGFDIEITSQTVRDFSGMKMDDIFAQHFSFIPKEKLQEFEKIYAKKESDYLKEFGGELFPKVKETLEQLNKNYRLFIVSNCMKGYIENFIEFFSFKDLFEDFECYGNAGLPKDKNIRLIVERNNLQNPVYVGDTIWDKESSEKAGVDFIYAAYGFGTIENPKIEIQNFEELLSIKF